MPTWLIPALKAVLPHVGTIVSAAAPVFTRKRASAVANQTIVLQQQITELQTAASENDGHIKELAAQVRTTIEALEQGVLLAEHRYRRSVLLSVAAVVLSVAALGTGLFILLTR